MVWSYHQIYHNDSSVNRRLVLRKIKVYSVFPNTLYFCDRVDKTFSFIHPIIGPFRGGNKPPVLPGEEKGFSKAKNGELKAAEVVAKN